MILEIIKILPLKMSRTEGVYFRVEFKGDNGRWYKTDIVPGYRNFKRWERVLKVGNRVFNLQLKDSMTVDADSQVMLLTGRRSSKIKRNSEAWAKANELQREDPQKFAQTYLF